jgi:hypothetical protein
MGMRKLQRATYSQIAVDADDREAGPVGWKRDDRISN